MDKHTWYLMLAYGVSAVLLLAEGGALWRRSRSACSSALQGEQA